jgi:hypothetical protein
VSHGRVRRLLGRFRKQPATPVDARTEVIEVATGVDFSDLTSVELCDRAVAEGRIEPFLLIGERFGGEPAGPNVILGPVGSAAAKARIDEEIAAAVGAGGTVNHRAGFDYGEGDSRIPRTVTFELGILGTRVLRLW